MKLLKTLSIFLAVCLCFSVILCGCKNEDSSSRINSDTDISSTITVTINQDDTIDPENTENPNGNGAEIKAEQLTAKTGKANGIDVSKWQGKINWQSVKKAGIDFAIIRIGYRAENGKIYKDEYADYNIQQADKAGILVGVYFFSTAINTSESLEEAKWTANAIKSYFISYPVVYDCEGFLSSTSRMYGISNANRTDNALAFLSHIKSLGYDSMLYAAKGELEGSTHWDTARIEKTHKIWVAHYSSVTYPQVETPSYSGKYDMWQYTNMGKVNGVSGNCDMIVSYFTNQKQSPKSNQKVEDAKVPVQKDTTYKEVNETVTAKELVNLRDAASTKSNIVGTLKNGDTLTRSGIGVNGWSKLLYNGKTVYAISSYLTTDISYKPPVVSEPQAPATNNVYTSVNETVTAKSETNLRSVASSKDSSTIVYTLKNGETVTRTGVGSNGWSRLSWNGQTVYAISSYLTTDLSYKPPVNSEPQEVSDGFTAVNEQVTAKSETNLRTVPSSKDPSTVVYTLKNGEYVTRIGIHTNGWSKLSWNGQTVYAISSYLTE